MWQSCGNRTFVKGKHLSQSDVHKSIGQDMIHWMGQRAVADATASTLPIIFERSW